ncbi:streptophobe family protein [Streptomyces sp. NPDC090306]|uniref:streptophobe family protein n=1 Tax=Streptomyces sp. NPDC090306 TaxID=3365961 RepID=UPI00381DACBF
MTTHASPSPGPHTSSAVPRHGWPAALAVVLAALVAMGAVAGPGLWAAGAAELPDGGFWRVLAATVVTAVGGSVTLSGDAGAFASSQAGLTLMPLSVTLTGALVLGCGFLRPLRHGPLGGRALGTWTLVIAVPWVLAVAGLAVAARDTFTISLGDGAVGGLGDLFGVSPKVGFGTDVAATVLVGLLWLAGVLLLALLVAPRRASAGRWSRAGDAVRPVARAAVAVLLVLVAAGLVAALVVAARGDRPRAVCALVLLGLPNLVWLAFTLGLGATWHGRLDGPFQVAVPRALEEVLRAPGVSTLDVRTLAQHDGRAWWLVAVAAVLVLAAAFVSAARTPGGVRPWVHALRTAAALGATVLMICLVGRISGHYGLDLFGLGDLDGRLSGALLLDPDTWAAVGLALLWGLVAGFVCAPLAARTGARRSDRATREV